MGLLAVGPVAMASVSVQLLLPSKCASLNTNYNARQKAERALCEGFLSCTVLSKKQCNTIFK